MVIVWANNGRAGIAQFIRGLRVGTILSGRLKATKISFSRTSSENQNYNLAQYQQLPLRSCNQISKLVRIAVGQVRIRCEGGGHSRGGWCAVTHEGPQLEQHVHALVEDDHLRLQRD
jgi:hypothetical protein